MQRVNKILSGNRITLPDDFLKHNKLAKGDYVVVDSSNGRLIIRRAEIKPKAIQANEDR